MDAKIPLIDGTDFYFLSALKIQQELVKLNDRDKEIMTLRYGLFGKKELKEMY